MGFRLAHLAAGVARAAASSSRLRGPRPAASALVAPLLASPWEPSGGGGGGQPHWLLPARGHVGHSHHHGEEEGGEASERIFRLGLAADVVLTVGKAVTGYLSGSTAIAADAAHSLSDIVLSGVALLSYKAAKAPRDKEHPYGHGKFESLGALGISSMLLVTAGGIAWHAFDVLQGVMSSAPEIIGNVSHGHHSHGSSGHHHGIDLEHPILALSVTAFAISVKEGLYWITKRAGEKEGSGLMKANAWHHRADAISSVVALIGVGGSILGVPYLDPLAGLVVSGMILKAGVHTGYDSVLELVDAAVDPSLLQPIKETILQVDGVKVYPFLSVSAAHDIGETVRHQIQKSHNQVAEVFIHIVESSMDQKGIWENTERRNSDAIPRQQTAEAIVSRIISSHFSKKMSLEHLMLHYLQGRVLLQVEVSMSPEIMIRDAMDIAKQAEQEILKADSSISQVSVQLRLGQQIKQLKLPGGKNGANNQQAQVQ
uniref:Cation efflux protein transmembrane domain-containing protein n=1 Tax=Oryza meridionalis TaxID=40149 RepID=A0A0E0D0D9_9ORYZ